MNLKKIKWLFVLLLINQLLISQDTVKRIAYNTKRLDTTAIIKPQDSNKFVLPEINRLYTEAIMKSLSSDYFEGRDLSRKSIEKSVRYLMAILNNNSIAPYEGRYLHPFQVTDSISSNNILSIIKHNPGSKEVILLTANYDNLGIIQENSYSDSIYNGANDNASGVCAVFQMGYFFKMTPLRENFVLAFTTGKRFGYSSIRNVIKQLKLDGYKVKFAVNFERIGIPIASYNPKLIIYEGMPSNLREILDSVDKKNILEVREFSNPMMRPEQTEQGLTYNLLKVPTYTITSFDYFNDSHFMTPQDEIQHIDMDFLDKSIKYIAEKMYYLLSENYKLKFKK